MTIQTSRKASVLSEKYRDILPANFLWGAASAAYQVEGAHLTDGKSLSVWDTTLPAHEDACKSYELFEKDIDLLKKLGCGVYRFSIAWTRILPGGIAGSTANEKGIQYYNKLIDGLIAAGIQPMATIFHFDTPQILQDKYGGFLSDGIIPDFVYYARLCFNRFGDRVKYWNTINEPLIYGMHSADGWNKQTWEFERDVPTVARNLLLCHAQTVHMYRTEFKERQQGQIGIVLNSNWCEPVDKSPQAKAAASLLIDYALGMYAGPIYRGEFPKMCLEEFGSARLDFTPEEWAVVKDSSDFFGLNSYSTSYATGARVPRDIATVKSFTFGRIEQVWERDGLPIGVRGHDNFPYNVPWGFRKLLSYIHDNYTAEAGIPIIITENGFAPQGEGNLPLRKALRDVQRQDYFAGYLRELFDAIVNDGIKVDGYIAWALTDNVEWFGGWNWRFGIAAIDKSNQYERVPKDSAKLLKDIFSHTIRRSAELVPT